MQGVSLAELHATLVEISAAAAVMQSEIKALIATHPDPGALRAVFLHEVERHTARALAMPVPDELSDRILALAEKALKDMPGGDVAPPRRAVAAPDPVGD